MAFVSERGSASDYLRDLAKQIDDGLLDCRDLRVRWSRDGIVFSDVQSGDFIAVSMVGKAFDPVKQHAVMYVDGELLGGVTITKVDLDGHVWSTGDGKTWVDHTREAR